MKFLEHLLGRGTAGVNNPVQRLEMTGLVTAEMIDVPAPPQPRMRQRQALPGDFEQIALPDSGLEAEPRHVIAQRLAFMSVPVLDEVPGGIKAGVVIELSNPERRQRRQPAPWHAVGAAHFQIMLQPHLGENRRKMVGPV